MVSVRVVLLAVLNLVAVVQFALLHGEVESVPLIVASRLIEEFECFVGTHRPGPAVQRLTLLSIDTELLAALEILIVQRPAVLLLIGVRTESWIVRRRARFDRHRSD